jgi:hypothetical protein
MQHKWHTLFYFYTKVTTALPRHPSLSYFQNVTYYNDQQHDEIWYD